MNRILKATLAALGLLATFTAPSQTIPHWVDRQVHGSARHLTPRHHKPDEPAYPGEEGYNQERPMRFTQVRHRTIRHRHYVRRHHSRAWYAKHHHRHHS